ncbi:MAG: endolytic transglycosylase MltG [Saprospiraceae bacterium]|nr:endolytic transglycosylase MltG [Saprospiraceae bacterium]
MTCFIPNTYEVFWNISPEKLVKRMQGEADKFWTDERKAKAAAIPLSKEEVYTLASIVEKESNNKKERPTVAGVYLNRLKVGEKLRADPTVVFAVGDFSIRRVLFEHVFFDSPYNTYLYQGLPPGPIYMPSTNAIDAVLNAEKHDYLFFAPSRATTANMPLP